MFCILCVKSQDRIIDIFAEEGLDLNACTVIGKHFWIQPNKDDVNAKYICESCWNELYSFHKFYKQVEAAHLSLLTGLKFEEEEDCASSIKSDSNTKSKLQETLENQETLVELKLPIANLANTTETNTTISNDEVESSGECEDLHSDDDDNEEEEEEKQKDEKPKTAPKSLTKNGKIRGRPLKGSIREKPTPNPNKMSKEQLIKKQQLSREFDTIIKEHMKLLCNICVIPLTDFSTLRKHFRSQHQERGYASCCDKKIYSKSVLVDHINTHLNPEHFKCDKCSKVLADRRCLEVHMDMHIEENQRMHQCVKCNKSFSKEILLTRHMHTHIPEEERKFPCEECSKLFSSNYSLKAHINNVHQNTYGKICDQCGKSIRGREAFQKHLLEHAGVPIPGEQCDKCGAKLKNKYCLKRHMRAKHADADVPHVCIICGRVAPNEPALQRHYYYVHKCERNHKCPMCEKAFKKASGLREHMTTHTGEILYTCPYCPKTFNSNANMHSHRKKMHRKEWEETRSAAANKI